MSDSTENTTPTAYYDQMTVKELIEGHEVMAKATGFYGMKSAGMYLVTPGGLHPFENFTILRKHRMRGIPNTQCKHAYGIVVVAEATDTCPGVVDFTIPTAIVGYSGQETTRLCYDCIVEAIAGVELLEEDAKIESAMKRRS